MKQLRCGLCEGALVEDYIIKRYACYSCKKRVNYSGQITGEYSICFEQNEDGTNSITEYFYNDASEIVVTEGLTTIMLNFNILKEIRKTLTLSEVKEWQDRLKRSRSFL